MLDSMPNAQDLEKLYDDAKTCAQLVGLSYVANDSKGYTRRKQGKGFIFLDSKNQALIDKELKQRITGLVIPPAWQNVWICPKPNGHVLVTGIDEKGRKQYIYHPKWRTMRDLIKFYRMIIFAKALPKIRAEINKGLSRRNLDRKKILATMLWMLENTYLRIGNDEYYEQNESIGLTTLTAANVITAGTVTTLSFKAKSGKKQQITFENRQITNVLRQLSSQPGTRLFHYKDSTTYKEIEPGDINSYLQEITGVHISAKDFRTWGGTLMAFNHLVHTEESKAKPLKPEKVVVQAVDAAAEVLGNTRSIARSSYVHPHILNIYGTKDFNRYYRAAQKKRKVTGLDKLETQLLNFLEQLFRTEFDLLKRHG